MLENFLMQVGVLLPLVLLIASALAYNISVYVSLYIFVYVFVCCFSERLCFHFHGIIGNGQTGESLNIISF